MAFVAKIKILCLLLIGSYGLKIIPLDLKLLYVNDKYVDDAMVNIRRYSRDGDYYLNIRGTLKHTMGNNVTINIIITEFLHNEYRRSFIEFHYKYCDMINKDAMFGAMLRMKGITCPTIKGKYHLMNMTVQSADFPNLWPFEKGGLDINSVITDTNEVIAQGYIHVLFKQKRKRA